MDVLHYSVVVGASVCQTHAFQDGEYRQDCEYPVRQPPGSRGQDCANVRRKRSPDTDWCLRADAAVFV